MPDDRTAIVLHEIDTGVWVAHRKGVQEAIVRSSMPCALGSLIRGLHLALPEAVDAHGHLPSEELGTLAMHDPRLFDITAEVIPFTQKPTP
jgi:hypothetical protein